MLAEVMSGLILLIGIFLFIIVIGSGVFTTWVNEQLRYLRLITRDAPSLEPPVITSGPEPVYRFLSWAVGDKRVPATFVRVSHAGRIRYWKDGRWMTMGGDAFFPLPYLRSSSARQSCMLPAYGSRTLIILLTARRG